MKKALVTFVLLWVCLLSFSQNDSINRLEEVWIQADRKLEKHSVGYKVITLNDSLIQRNPESFTALLRFNTPIYLREFGAGGTSSASFRGTSASNTAVIWNGININSINNGQTGFNSLTVSLFDAIDVRSGGGSIEYGSGAVGGTIHLNDNLKFSDKKCVKNQVVSTIGSFETYQNLYKFKLTDNKLALNFGVSYNQSENNYKLLDTEFRNFNGAFKNLGFNASGAFLLSNYSNLKFYTANYSGERFFSGELPNPLAANDKYQDFNHRNLLIYTNEVSMLKHEVQLAHLMQEYRFFDDREADAFNFGKSNQYLVRYNASLSIAKWYANIFSYLEYESAFGKTDQIEERNRQQLSQSFVYKQNLKSVAFFEAKIRKDFNSDYEVPFTHALGLKIKPLKNLFIRANTSKNYRVPTYNDLFWPGQGNLELTPETSKQFEVGVGYKNNTISVDIATFQIYAKDKIVWTPNGDLDRPGIWVPINLRQVNNKGVEFVFSYDESFNKHNFQFDLNYSYVQAIDERTDKQVIFVPKHLSNLSLGYNFKRFSFFSQQVYNGKVYTTESNSEDFLLPSIFIVNTGMEYKLLNKKGKQLIIGLKCNNLLNKNYVSQPRRPMPNRNFNFNINYKF